MDKTSIVNVGELEVAAIGSEALDVRIDFLPLVYQYMTMWVMSWVAACENVQACLASTQMRTVPSEAMDLLS